MAPSFTQKMGVVGTLLDRYEKMVTEEDGKIKDKETIGEVFKLCGYPQWTVTSVKEQMAKKEENEKSRGMIIIPYMKGLSERIAYR